VNIDAWPLAWPEGWKRSTIRKDANFGTTERKTSGEHSWIARKGLTMQDAIKRLRLEMERLGVSPDDVVVSTNVKLNLMGNPRGDQEPSDPGVAVYWSKKGSPATKVIAIDAYRRVRDNIAAIAKTLEAMRAIERHGGAVILERAFAGFAAITPPDWKKPWREVFNLKPDAQMDPAELRGQYRALSRMRHPDNGHGSNALMAELNVAYDEAKRELGID
jgi:hypothetical protein